MTQVGHEVKVHLREKRSRIQDKAGLRLLQLFRVGHRRMFPHRVLAPGKAQRLGIAAGLLSLRELREQLFEDLESVHEALIHALHSRNRALKALHLAQPAPGEDGGVGKLRFCSAAAHDFEGDLEYREVPGQSLHLVDWKLPQESFPTGRHLSWAQGLFQMLSPELIEKLGRAASLIDLEADIDPSLLVVAPEQLGGKAVNRRQARAVDRLDGRAAPRRCFFAGGGIEPLKDPVSLFVHPLGIRRARGELEAPLERVLEALAKLRGRLHGERDRRDALERRAALKEVVENSLDDEAGLAGAGARRDHEALLELPCGSLSRFRVGRPHSPPPSWPSSSGWARTLARRGFPFCLRFMSRKSARRGSPSSLARVGS